MKFKITFAFFLILLSFSCQSKRNDLELIAKQAESNFVKGDLIKAHALYEELINSGVSNPLIYERLADSSQDLGLKVYYLRKAIELDCGNSCIEKINQIRSQINFKPELIKERAISNNLRAILILIFSILLCICLVLFNFVNIKLFALGFAPVSLALIWLALANYCQTDYPSEIETCIIKNKPFREKQAVVTQEGAYALSSKQSDSQAVLALPQGAEVIVIEINDNWARLKLPNNRTGWIIIENLKLL